MARPSGGPLLSRPLRLLLLPAAGHSLRPPPARRQAPTIQRPCGAVGTPHPTRASAGAVEATARIVAQIRATRADPAAGGFARDELMVLRSRCDRLLRRRRRNAAGARPTASTWSSVSPATPASWPRSRRRWRRPKPSRPPACPATSPTEPSTAGAARGAWWPRPSTWPRARTRASS